MRRLALLVSVVWAAGGPAAAQDVPGDPAGGATLAREVCAECHLVAEDQTVDPGIGSSLLFAEGRERLSEHRLGRVAPQENVVLGGHIGVSGRPTDYFPKQLLDRREAAVVARTMARSFDREQCGKAVDVIGVR